MYKILQESLYLLSSNPILFNIENRKYYTEFLNQLNTVNMLRTP